MYHILYYIILLQSRLTLTAKRLKHTRLFFFALLHFLQENKNWNRQFWWKTVFHNTKLQYHYFQRKHFYYKNHHVCNWNDNPQVIDWASISFRFSNFDFFLKWKGKAPNGIVGLLSNKFSCLFSYKKHPKKSCVLTVREALHTGGKIPSAIIICKSRNNQWDTSLICKNEVAEMPAVIWYFSSVLVGWGREGAPVFYMGKNIPCTCVHGNVECSSG